MILHRSKMRSITKRNRSGKMKLLAASLLIAILIQLLFLSHLFSYAFSHLKRKNDKEITLPSTLTDPPIKVIVPPGQCQFSKKFTSVPLIEKFKVSPTSFVLRFGLPDGSKALGLSTCACLLAGIKIEGENEMVIRPYTPISTNKMIGTFDLLVKVYPDGKMSSHITSLEPSPTQMSISFMHIPFNMKIQYPFGNPTFIGMIAGGTGIAPMIQALHAILGESMEDRLNETNETISPKVSLLYGSKTFDDILGKEMLDSWLNSHGDQLAVTHALSQEFEDPFIASERESNYKIERGRINRKLIQKSFPSPESNVQIFVCGPPGMYEALCGPRDQEDVTGILGELGYSSDQVYKF